MTLPALHLVHDELRCVPHEAIREIAEMLDLHPAEVHDTMTFYGSSATRSDKLGKTRLWVCRGLACMLRGGDELLEHCEQKLGVKLRRARRRTARSRWSSRSASAPARGAGVLVDDVRR